MSTPSNSSSDDEQMDVDVRDDLPEWTEFNLSTASLRGIKSMGFTRPTKIQSKVLPLAVEQGLDILGAAETGSGKTMAFVIPVVERWQTAITNGSHEHGRLFALIITPTRELAVQIRKELESVAKHTAEPKMRSLLLCGGINQQKQERLLRKCPDVIVATPGRLWKLIELGDSHVDDLSSVRMLVVDEVDRMLERGHFQELGHIIARTHANINGTIDDDDKVEACDSLQTLVFSATLTFTHAPIHRADGSSTKLRTAAMKVGALVKFMKMRSQRAVVDVTTQAAARPAGLVESRMHCIDLNHKDANLYYLLNRYGGRTLVFTNSIDAVKRLYNLLNTLRFQPPPKIIHAKMLEQKRLKNLEKFAETENAVLLATDVAARGLDIRGVENVIHYQMPRTSELYVHRSGRTARAERVGLSVLFVDPTDLPSYIRIRKNLCWKEDLELLAVDQPKLMEACLYRVGIASKFESTEFAHKKASSRNEWFKRLAQEADMILDDDLMENDEENGTDESPFVRELRLKRKGLEKALNAALRQPLPSVGRAMSTTPLAKTVACNTVPSSSTTTKAELTAAQTKTSKGKRGTIKKGSDKKTALGKVVVGDDVQNLITTEKLRERLHLEKKPVESLKRHFKKRKRTGNKRK